MKDFFEDIFAYQHHFNQLLADLLIENAESVSERSALLFSHMINAHQVWNSRILGEKSFGVWDMRPLEENKSLDGANYNDTLKILSQFDFAQPIEYKTSRGDELSNTVREILFHASNHHTHHRAQIVANLRQNGVEPIMTDYIFFKR